MKLRLLLVLLFFVVSAPLAAQEIDIDASQLRRPVFDPAKACEARFSLNKENISLDPLLRRVVRESGALDKAGMNAIGVVEAMREIIQLERRGEMLYASVFVKTLSPAETRNATERNGGYVMTTTEDIVTASIPVAALNDVAAAPGVVGIQASRYARAAMDVSRDEIGATNVHNGENLPQPYTGRNVVVGLVDSGIDEAFADFRDTTGSTNESRILNMWDMSDETTTTVTAPPEFSYGKEYSKADIEAGICNQSDPVGHGTHVAGIAAGNGRLNVELKGIAPEADIISVKGFREQTTSFANTDVINGCDYIFRRAQALGKPAVINLSLGGHSGSHDGRSFYEQALSNLVGPGKLIVAAAGNEGRRAIHLKYATGGSLQEPRVTFFKAPGGASEFYIEMWYDGGAIDVGLATYDQYPWLIEYTPPVAPGQLADFTLQLDGVVAATATIDARNVNDVSNGARQVFIVVRPNPQVDVSAMTFALYTFGSGTLDAWFLGQGEFSLISYPQYFIMPGDYFSSIAIPATSQRLISVGSYVTKNQWIDVAGMPQTQGGGNCNAGGNVVVGVRSCFSSRGPTRDGRIKPDIAAPGEIVFSAMSADIAQPDITHIHSNGHYVGIHGTSMAAPHVTGTVALMLERNPNLDYATTLDILTRTARKETSIIGPTPNNVYGNGKLNAWEAVRSTIPGKTPLDQTVTGFALGAYPNPAAAFTTVRYSLPTDVDISLQLFDIFGRELRVLHSGPQRGGEHTTTIETQGLPAGMYSVRLNAGPTTLTYKILVAGA